MANIDSITNLYVGYFNRAPDPAGLNFWVSQLNAGASLAGVANSFSLVPEATNLYGFLSAPLIGSPASFLTSVYANLFNRVANATTDAAGFAYWTAQLTAPGAVVGRIIVDIISGAQGDDLLVVNNKSAVGKAFSQELVNVNGVFNLTAAKNAFALVTKDAATVATATAANALVIGTTAGNAGGLTFTLTASPDTLVGSAANDTFNALVDSDAASGQTLTSADNVDGSGGAGDIFNILFDTAAATAFPNATISNIEIFNLRNVSGNTLAFDSSLIVGDTAVNADRSTNQIDITKLATGASVGVIGNGSVANGAVNIGYNTATDAGILNISGGTTGGAIAYTTTPTSVTINSTLAANTIGALDVGAAAAALTINATTNLTTGALTGAAVKTITVNGAATSVTIGGTLPVGVTSVNGSGLTAGGVTATLGAVTTAFTGGAGNDTLSIGALVFNASTKLDAGAGTGDVLNMTDQASLTAATVPNFIGFDILRFSDDDDGALDTFNVALLAGVTGVQLNADSAADGYSVQGLSAAQAGNITIRGTQAVAPVFGVTGATTVGQIDTLALAINDGSPVTNTLTVANITAAGVEIVNFATTDHLTLSSATGLTALTNSTITGSGNVSITTGALALNVNTTINAAASTGTFTFDAGLSTANGISITGSSTKANTITGNLKADTLVGGAVNDTIANQASGNNASAADVITTGTGPDTVILRGDSASAATYGGSSNVTDFAITTVATTTDILQLSATAGNYSNVSAFFAGVAAAAAGATGVQSVAQNAATVAITAGTDLIKLTTGVAAGASLQATFNSAIGTASVSGLGAGADIFASFYDTTNSKAVIVAVNATGGADGTVETADVVSLVGTLNMSAADYALFGANQLSIIAA